MSLRPVTRSVLMSTTSAVLGLGGGPPPAVPVNTVPPAVTGATGVGNVLSCSTGTWTNSPTGYAYQWRNAGVPISGQTASTYTTVSGDIGDAIDCVVTASNADGSGLPVDSNDIVVTDFTPATISYLQAVSVIETVSSKTFTAVNIGAANAKRVVAVAIYLRHNATSPTVTAVTIGGVAATILQAQTGTHVRMAIAYAAVPAGTTADVAITLSAAISQIGIGTYRVIADNPVAADNDNFNNIASTSASLPALSGCNAAMYVVSSSADGNGTNLVSVGNGVIDVQEPEFNHSRVGSCGRITDPSQPVTFVCESAINLSGRSVGWA